jgi:hypothetical protein
MLEFNVLLTSFFKAKKFDLENKFNVACWKPDWCKHKDLEFLFPIDVNGERIRLRRFEDPINGYIDCLRDAYSSRWDTIEIWMNSLKNTEQHILCCWCPSSSVSKEQLVKYGTFFCHTVLIGKMLKIHRPDLIIKLDEDRATKSIPETIEWYKQ